MKVPGGVLLFPAAAVAFLFFLIPSTTAQPNFVASYRAEYKQDIIGNCTWDHHPIVRVGCHGTIQLQSVSHSTIVCGAEVQEQPESTPYSYIECRNVCGSIDDCLDVWLTTFAHIDFECSGNDIDNIDSFMSMEEGDSTNNWGLCFPYEGPDTPPLFQTVGRFARIGVRCDNQYDFDDFYFNCDFADPISINSLNDTTANPDGFHDDHACLHFSACPNDDECSFEFDTFLVQADHLHFDDNCIETPNGTPIPERTAPEVTTDVPLFAIFSAAWATLVDDQQPCASEEQRIRIECMDGNIELFGTLPTGATCMGDGTSILDCVDSSPATDFVEDIQFKCGGNKRAPRVKVTYLEGDVSCDNNDKAIDVNHAVQLAILCWLAPDNPQFFTLDGFVECGEKSHQFAYLNLSGESGAYRTCAEGASFQAGSSSANKLTIPDVSMKTDNVWNSEFVGNCLQTPITDSGPPSGSTARSSESSSTGAIVGGVFGGLAAVAVVAALVVVLKRRRKPKETLEEGPIPSADPVKSRELELSVMFQDKSID